MSTELWLLVNVVAGAFGFGYFIYGKKQGRPIPLIAGVLLCVYPYFVSSTLWLLLIGVILIVVPLVIRPEA